jgi:peptide deformylase
MYDDLEIIHYPDPRLRKISAEVEKFDDSLKQLVERMFVLMRQDKGVGLAAPQVGKNIRLFIINPTTDPKDDRVYINPMLSEGEGEETAEEGCLSLPDIHIDVPRNKTMKLEARDLAGNAIEDRQSGYIARIWQHELDHLNGILLLDRMGPVAKMANRKKLKEMEEEYTAKYGEGWKKRKK